MKKLFLTITASILLSSVGAYASTQQDTVRTTVKGVVFKTIQSDNKKYTVAIYNGKEYDIQGSLTAYKKQVNNFGDCRVLLVGDKMIIL